METVEKVDWFCPKCNSYVSSESVTFEETHQICKTGVILKPLNQNNMKITKRELGLKFRLGKNASEIDKILYHIYHLQGLISYNLRRGKKVHYCRKQIEVAKRKLKTFKSQLHPIELRTINL